MTGTRQHYQPAAVIGGFGSTCGAGGKRSAPILWRRREWAQARRTTANNIGFRNGMYRLASPTAGVDPDLVDQAWDQSESAVPQAIDKAQKCRDDDADHLALADYAAMIGVRHPEFGEAVNRWRTERGWPAVSGDGVQLERLDVLGRARPQVRGFRWRLVHSPKDAHRFILNDRGWTYFGQEGRSGRALFIPLNGRLAMIGWVEPGRAGVFDHRVLRPSWVRWLNAATWADASEYVVGHPTDASVLRRLRTPDEVAHLLHGAGPYRGRDQGLLSDR